MTSDVTTYVYTEKLGGAAAALGIAESPELDGYVVLAIFYMEFSFKKPTLGILG